MFISLSTQTLGKVGRVIEVYGDGDLKVDVRDSVWTFNSKVVRKVDSDGVPLTPSTSGESISMSLTLSRSSLTLPPSLPPSPPSQLMYHSFFVTC